MSKRAVNPTIRLDEDAKLELERLAKSSKYTQQFIASHAIMQVDSMGMLEPDWEASIKELDAVRTTANRYDFLDDPCEALCFIDDHFECWWGRKSEGKPPQKTRIGKMESSVIEGCNACNRSELMVEKLVTAEMKLAKGIVVDIPSCEKGGKLLDDGKKIMCLDPNKSAQPRDVKKFCRVVRGGANCEHLRWSKVELKGKQFELDKKSV